ncbi:MAG: EVE domain-containing protein [Pirellulaceae bacterium]
MKHWLLKSEPENYSIDDLANEKNKTTLWDGVRNYQARNTIRDDMSVGDLAFFYHSNDDPPGIVGVCKVVKAAYPDPTALDKKSKYFDEKSSVTNPRWFVVDVKLVKKFKSKITLDDLKPMEALKNMELLRKGSRLSVQPVSENEYETIMKLAR